MEASTLARNIDLISTVGGATLNLEHRASLPAALAILQSENNFARVTLWGRISGDKQDYIIAQGWTPTPDEKTERSKIAGGNALIAEYFELMKQIPKSSFRLSPDGVTFVPIPPVDDEIVRQNEELTKALNAKGQVFAPFTGDPAAKTQYEFVIPAPPKEPKEAPAEGAEEGAEGEEAAEGGEGGGEGEEDEEEPKATVEEREVAEEARLAYTIHLIDQDTSVVPKGAFVLGSSSHVMINSAFRGLEEHESRKLTSFLHLRAPNKLQDLSATDKSALTASLDFLDNLGMDEPKGCWALGFDGQNCMATLRSLLWPGYSFYHVVGTNNFGAFYSGTGEVNLDIAFML